MTNLLRQRAISLSDVMFGLLLTYVALAIDPKNLMASNVMNELNAVETFGYGFVVLAILWSMHSVLMARYFFPDVAGYALNFVFFYFLIAWCITIDGEAFYNVSTYVDLQSLALAFVCLLSLFIKGTIVRFIRELQFSWTVYVGLKNVAFCCIALGAVFVVSKTNVPPSALIAGTNFVKMTILSFAIAVALLFIGLDFSLAHLKSAQHRYKDAINMLAGWSCLLIFVALTLPMEWFGLPTYRLLIVVMWSVAAAIIIGFIRSTWRTIQHTRRIADEGFANPLPPNSAGTC